MSDEVNLGKRQRESIEGDCIIAAMDEGAVLKVTGGNAVLRGTMQPWAILTVRDGNLTIDGLASLNSDIEVKRGNITLTGDLFGNLVLKKGVLTIDAPLPPEAYIRAEKVVLGPHAKIRDINNEEPLLINRLEVPDGITLVPGTVIKTKREIVIHAAKICAGHAGEFTLLSTKGTMRISPLADFVRNEKNKAISLSARKLLAPETEFTETSITIKKELDALSLSHCSVNIVDLAATPINIALRLAENSIFIVPNASLVIDNLVGSKVIHAAELRALKIKGGQINAHLMTIDDISGKAVIKTNKLLVTEISQEAIVSARDSIIAERIGDGSIITVKYLQADDLGLCKIDAGIVEAGRISHAVIKATTVHADLIALSARIEAEEIYIKGVLVARGSWPEGRIARNRG